MTPKELERILDSARKAGADEAEVYYRQEKVLTVTVRGGEVHDLVRRTTSGLALRVVKGGRIGFVSASAPDKATQDALAARALAVAQTVKAVAGQALNTRFPEKVPDLMLLDPHLAEVPIADKVELAKRLEAGALAGHRWVKRTDGARYSETLGSTSFASSHGWSGSYETTRCGLYVDAVATDPEGKHADSSASGSHTSLTWKGLPIPERLGMEAAEHAGVLLGGVKVASQDLPVVFSPLSAGPGLLGWGFGQALNGEHTRRNASFLAEKLEQMVASNLVTLTDEGAKFEGLASAPFDDEGHPTSNSILIENGRLRAYLYDHRNAREAEATSTGNGFRSSYEALPEFRFTNLTLRAGKQTVEQLIRPLPIGFYVEETMGFGTDIVGDSFSVAARGRMIRNGELAEPVRDASLSGRLSAMLLGIDGVANDLVFRFAGGRGAINCPTFRISQMHLSGGA